MKKKPRSRVNCRNAERQKHYISFRFIAAILLALLATAAVIGIVVLLCMVVPYFYLLVWATEIAFVIRIIASDENPDYKIPWLLVVLVIPVAGLMLYLLFHSRTLKRKYIRRMEHLKNHAYDKDDTEAFEQLAEENLIACNQAKMLCRISEAHLFQNTKQTYFPLGDDMFPAMLEDLRRAEKFIFLEYFIIEEGLFWNSVLHILREKAAAGVEVRLVYDDIGCMTTLPGDYWKTLQAQGIQATPFALLRGNADSEFNNRSHRKILVIDGRVGYTGGANIADEYINKVVKYGHWKDTGLRMEGEAVKELTKLFLIDYGLNVRGELEVRQNYFPDCCAPDGQGFLIPFGDGPVPVYTHQVGKSLIQNMLNQAQRYVYMMSPYLIIDSELCRAIENAALRGVDVRVIVPHIPDKKLIFEMTRSHYARLMEAGVQIYEYEPGFIHAKCYLADDEIAMVGTINLDYRSLVHHFENGVWMYRCACLTALRQDFEDTLAKSIHVDESMIRQDMLHKLIRSLVKIFSPML